MKRKLVMLLASALALSSVTACGSMDVMNRLRQTPELEISESETEETEETEETQSTEYDAGKTDKEMADQELYNAYIDVNNKILVGRLYDSLDRYFNYVAFQEEFSPNEDYYDCYSVDYLMDDLDQTYSLASAKTETDEIDDAFLAMYPSLKELMTVLDEIYDYTDLESYVDDDYARGKEYHARLWNAYNEYEPLSAVFMEKLGEADRIKNEEILSQLKEEGYECLYAVNCVINSARELQEELYEQGVSDENILEMDMEKVQPIYDEFVTNVEAVLQYSKDEEKLEEEGIPVNSAHWSMFLSSMRDSKKSLTQVIQHVKDQEPLSQSDLLITEIAGNSSLASFYTGVSEMIDYYNSF